MIEFKRTNVTTSDEARLNILEAGSGPPLLLIPGWSQTAAIYRHQLEGLSDRYRVIALDLRGHGESQNVEYGYRLSRLAMDVHEVISALDLEAVSVLGHSMGNAILFCHWDLFGRDRFSKLIIAEQPPTLLAQPDWSLTEREIAGCITTAEQMWKTCENLVGTNAEKFAAELVTGMLSPAVSREDREFIIKQNLMMPRQAASTLYQNTASADWRDLIPRIDIPTLIVAGKASIVPFASQQWIQQHVPGAKLVAFEGNEGGSHFMFFENFKKFNRTVAEFLA
ncbi:MAG: alpha/beta hydrolase [Planctomycetaceae bacterium]|nr:alpha/beta hydrolase [Planctomycetaceae bacterium]